LRRGDTQQRKTRNLVFGALLLGVFSIGSLAAADAVKVRVQPGQSLRDIAQQQLGDPDLWTEIPRANGLASITDVHPGMELTVPAAEIAAADRALRRALAALQQATADVVGGKSTDAAAAAYGKAVETAAGGKDKVNSN